MLRDFLALLFLLGASSSFPTIHQEGVFKVSRQEIKDELEIIGSLIAKDAEIEKVHVTGEANLTNVAIEKGGFIMGYVHAKKTKVEAPLTLFIQKSVFEECSLHSLFVQQDVGFKGKQILELKKNTRVDGDIEFESKKGEVIVDLSSQVLGKIKGGKWVQLKE